LSDDRWHNAKLGTPASLLRASLAMPAARLPRAARRRRAETRRTARKDVLNLAHDGALVPAPQHEMRDERQREEDDDAGEREEDERGEHARDIESVAGLDDTIRKPRAGAGGARGDFRDHCADQREPARDL